MRAEWARSFAPGTPAFAPVVLGRDDLGPSTSVERAGHGSRRTAQPCALRQRRPRLMSGSEGRHRSGHRSLPPPPHSAWPSGARSRDWSGWWRQSAPWARHQTAAFRTVAIALLLVECPDRYSGCCGVGNSGVHAGSGLGTDVVVRIAVVDSRDGSPEVERVLGLPAHDARIGRRQVDQGQGARRRREVQAVRSNQLARDAVPDRRWRCQPEACDLGLLVRPRRAGQRPELLHLVVVARIAPGVKRWRTIWLEWREVPHDPRGNIRPAGKHRHVGPN